MQKNELYRECELKFKVKDSTMEKQICKIIIDNGYLLSKEVIETDFIIDTENFLCRKNHLLFRIRYTIKKGNSQPQILYTIKLKGKSTHFQDHREIEFLVGENNEKNIVLIIDVLKKYTDIKLVVDDFKLCTIENILLHLFTSGFNTYEIMQKKRSYFDGRDSQITFDKFPSNIGTYIEIESDNEVSLFKTVKLLNFKKEEMEKRTYGQLILEKKKECIFDDKLFIHPTSGKSININEFRTVVLDHSK